MINNTRNKGLIFGTLALLMLTLFLVALFLIDISLHKKYDEMAAPNYRGYRGQVVGNKLDGELRIAVFGGSVAVGYGLAWKDAIPAQLQNELLKKVLGYGYSSLSVINLAWNSEGAYSLIPLMKDFRYLNYDIAVLITGIDDIANPNMNTFRQESSIFRLLGYYPVLPLIMREKAMSLRYGGDLNGAYLGNATVFRPNVMDQAKALTIEAALEISNATGKLMKVDSPHKESTLNEQYCKDYKQYCQYMKLAIDYELQNKKKVVIVTEPYIEELHIKQQKQLHEMVLGIYKNNPSVLIVNLGMSLNHLDKNLSYDGIHLTDKGSYIFSKALASSLDNFLKKSN